MKQATIENLTNLVEFDCPFRVSEGGMISRADGIYAPECIFGNEIDDKDRRKFFYPFPGEDRWELVSGFSRQDAYPGPVMHNSEYLGGAMAQYVLDNPSVYVLMVVQWDDEETPYDEADGYYVEGWVLARYKEGV